MGEKLRSAQTRKTPALTPGQKRTTLPKEAAMTVPARRTPRPPSTEDLGGIASKQGTAMHFKERATPAEVTKPNSLHLHFGSALTDGLPPLAPQAVCTLERPTRALGSGSGAGRTSLRLHGLASAPVYLPEWPGARGTEPPGRMADPGPRRCPSQRPRRDG